MGASKTMDVPVSHPSQTCFDGGMQLNSIPARRAPVGEEQHDSELIIGDDSC